MVWWNHRWVKKSQACKTHFCKYFCMEKIVTIPLCPNIAYKNRSPAAVNKQLLLSKKSSIYYKRYVYFWQMEGNLEHWRKKVTFFCLIQSPGILNSTLWYLTNLQGICFLENSVWILYKRHPNIWILFPIPLQLTFTKV